MTRAGSFFRPPLRGIHVLLMVLAFFSVIIAVNLVFIMVSLETFSGIETENAYEEGRRYNEVLAAAERQSALGWKVNVEAVPFEAEADATPVLVRVAFADRDGRPISGLPVEVSIVRPTHEGLDQEGPLVEKDAGVYEARFDLPAAGQWTINVMGMRANGAPYQVSKLVFLSE